MELCCLECWEPIKEAQALYQFDMCDTCYSFAKKIGKVQALATKIITKYVVTYSSKATYNRPQTRTFTRVEDKDAFLAKVKEMEDGRVHGVKTEDMKVKTGR